MKLFSGRVSDTIKCQSHWLSNKEIIHWGGICPLLTLPDSEKPDLFRVNPKGIPLGFSLITSEVVGLARGFMTFLMINVKSGKTCKMSKFFFLRHVS